MPIVTEIDETILCPTCDKYNEYPFPHCISTNYISGRKLQKDNIAVCINPYNGSAIDYFPLTKSGFIK